METKLPHLILPKAETRFRKKPPKKFGYADAERDAGFYETEVKKLQILGEKYQNESKNYTKYFQPNLIFKIQSKGVSDESFRKDLKRGGIEVISSAPDKKGYWVGFSEDITFEKFKKEVTKRVQKEKASFIDAIESFGEIPPEEKLGELLNKKGFSKDEVSYLDIEIWRMPNEKLQNFVNGLKKYVTENEGEVTDELITENLCLLRVQVNYKIYNELIKMREISFVDRPPQIKIETEIQKDLKNIESIQPPKANNCGILILDSGINSGHPLLEKAIKEQKAFATLDGSIQEDLNFDDAFHGTKVAGIALYGNLENMKTFKPEIWLYSGKIMFRDPITGNATFNEKELIEHQLQDAVKYFKEGHEKDKIKIINLSLGNSASKMFEGQRQLRIASIIDDLAKKYDDVIFVISAGNNIDDIEENEKYPDYLLENSKRGKIIDPGTAANAITVGSIYYGGNSAKKNPLPSPFTRVGPGLRGMIKPELVENGGGKTPEIVTTNPQFVSQGRLLTLERGTSFSTPKIAHYLALLKNSYQSYSRNLIKALLLTSAAIPTEKPSPLNKLSIEKNGDYNKLLNIYGYGIPDLQKAMYSQSNRVLLMHEGKIGIDKIQFFEIKIPKEFIDTKGAKKITVSLVFDPPVNRNRTDYLGVTMEHQMFKNSTMNEVKEAYSKIQVSDKDDIVPKEISKKRITFMPGVNIRKKGVHQISHKSFVGKPRMDSESSLILAAICQKKWVTEKDFLQNYSILVTFEHEMDIDLYNLIQLRNRTRVRIR